jgi:hypothetical protein
MSLYGIDLPQPVRVRTSSYAHSRKIPPSTGLAVNLLCSDAAGIMQRQCSVLEDRQVASWEPWARDLWELVPVQSPESSQVSDSGAQGGKKHA